MQIRTQAEVSAAGHRATATGPHKTTDAWITPFIGGRETKDKLHAFLAENVPNNFIEPHFHPVNQYQIFVHGTAKLGKKSVGIGVLHYTDEYVPYGPIVADDEGVSFFTLRQFASVGVHYMPGSRDKQLTRGGRQLIGAVEPGTPGDSHARELFSRPDGVAAFELAAAPMETLPLPVSAPEHGGAYVVVVSGTLHREGQEYGRNTCIGLDPGERVPALTAGPEGAVAAYMSFPRGAIPRT